MAKEPKTREKPSLKELLVKLEAEGDPDAFMEKLRKVAEPAKARLPAKKAKSKAE